MARKTNRPIRPNPFIATLTAIIFLSSSSIETDNQALHVNAEASTVNENSGVLARPWRRRSPAILYQSKLKRNGARKRRLWLR
jgi:hypothetical protein